ncbi:hypothetical protein CMUS01_13282 [Colletotrichum musicola]|uniref:Uncharacterized protein n=1 Tax=Colletotrichum musicola TaxID=2175873 RepID=A0A8H6JF37_9PEZI|nr:hypothetical protein CMUS01_13282 [Colletotrichum musicola]
MTHVQKLKDAFVKDGLERSAPKNRIAVLYSTKEVRRIQKSTEGGSDSHADDNDSSDKKDRLVAATANGCTREAVKAAFYTSNSDDGSYYYTTGLLKTIDNAAYRKVYRAMWTALDLALVDLKHLLYSKRPEIETAVRVLHHIIG